ncbi:MAG: sensor histidine kinase, partial [Bacilli bacterium]|nr:sensor histidine kinase [Bacilli bacterium]
IPTTVPALRTLVSTFKYVLLASFLFVSIRVCYKLTWMPALFVATGAYAIQHLSSELESLFIKGFLLLFPIEGSTFVLQLITTIVFILGFVAIVYFVGKKKRKNGKLHIKSVWALFLVIAAILVDITLSGARNRALRGIENAETIQQVMDAYGLIASFLVVFLLFSLVKSSDLQDDLILTDALLKKEREQWERSKELMETVNIRCHDLKHRIHAIRKSGEMDPALLKDIENDIGLYEATIQTGNEAVDVLLNERLSFCKNEGILFSTMVDGPCLSFIELPDLYSLLGNAISNAIEAAMRIQDHQKRVINLIVKNQKGFVSIHVENYFEKVDKDENGMLRTTKADAHNHGFGVKSMTRIVEKYHGTISLSQDGDVFLTDILLPMDA